MNKLIKNNLLNNRENTYAVAIWIIIALGVSLRLFHYLNNRSLWEDEIYLSTGLIKLSLADLFTRALDFQQKAPIGYLVIAKVCLLCFGNNEMALRLFPFLCGIASLFVFLPVARFFLQPIGVIVCVSLLAFAPPLLYHSVEAKQYSTELLATIVILWLYTRYHDKTDKRSLLVFGFSGAFIVWFSYSAVFILAGVAAALGLFYITAKKWGLLIKQVIVFLAWFISFGINYKLFTQKGAHTEWLVFFFTKHDSFMPVSTGAFRWLAHRILSFYNYPMGLSWFRIYKASVMLKQMIIRMVFVPIFFSLTGFYYLYRTNKKLLLLITATFGIVFLASAIKLYPFHERLTVFLAPCIILLLAAGCEAIFQVRSPKPLWKFTLVVLLLLGPVINTIVQAAKPGLFGDYKKSYQREALLYVNKHYQPGDMVYVYWNDLPGYRLYNSMYHFRFNAIEGKDHRYEANSFADYFAKVDNDLKKLNTSKRVWVIQNNGIDIKIGDFIGDPPYYYLHNDGPGRFHDYVLQLGKETDHFQPANSSAQSDIGVSLIDFSGK